MKMKWFSVYPLAGIPENDFLAAYTAIFATSLVVGQILLLYGILSRTTVRRTIYAIVAALAVAHFAADWQCDRIREHWTGWERVSADYLLDAEMKKRKSEAYQYYWGPNRRTWFIRPKTHRRLPLLPWVFGAAIVGSTIIFRDDRSNRRRRVRKDRNRTMR